MNVALRNGAETAYRLPLRWNHRVPAQPKVIARARRMTKKQEQDRGQPDYSALIVAIAERSDREAFSALFRHFAPRIKTFMMRAGTASNQAEEFAQEAMLAVWRKAAYFDPARAGAATWIFTIARNLRIDAIRRERGASSYQPDASDAPPEPMQSDSIVMAEERDRKIREALSKLSAEQRTIVQLSFFQEKPHQQISRELKLPLGTVKSRIRLAMNKLRELLDDQP